MRDTDDQNMFTRQRTGALAVFFFLCLSQASAKECGCSLVTTFMALISGEYSNVGDLGRQSPAPAHDDVYLILYEVDIPALKPDRVLYFEEKLNSIVLRQEVMVVSVTDEGFIQMVSYNFTLPAGSGNFSALLLSDLPLSAFSSRPECVTIYRPMEYNIFIGTYPDCTGHFDGLVASYTIMLSCNSIATVTSFNLFPETSSQIPYSMWKISSLPLLSYGSCGGSILEDLCTC